MFIALQDFMVLKDVGALAALGTSTGGLPPARLVVSGPSYVAGNVKGTFVAVHGPGNGLFTSRHRLFTSFSETRGRKRLPCPSNSRE